MTVVAFKDGVMAADTQLSPSGHRTNKLARMPDGGVVGAAGLWASCYAGLSWFADGGSLDGKGGDGPPDVTDADFLIARPDGSVWAMEGRFPAYPLLDKFTAIGSGEDYARMAMELGLSAVEAVQRVTKRSPECGDPVQSMAVQETHEYPGVTTHKRQKS